MSECTRLSDRMPLVAAGGDVWTAEELAHLETCADCAGEWALVRAGESLGRDSGYAPDPDRVASVVLGRLRADRIARNRSVRRATWAAGLAAAAIALSVWTGRPERRAAAVAAPIESAALVPELDSLDAGELKDVLDSFDAPLSERVMPVSPTLGDLSDQELERVLRAGGV